MMKTTFLVSLLFTFMSVTCFSQVPSEINNDLLYGQLPPGSVPELYEPEFSFMEGIMYNDLAFSSDGSELCFTMLDTIAKQNCIYYLKKEKGDWKIPEKAYFIPNNSLGDVPQFSPDGTRFSYTYKGDLWSSRKKNNKWTMAEKLPEPVCSDEYECGFSFAKSGSIYFASAGRAEGKGRCDIYCSTINNNLFEQPQNLGNLNTDASECIVSVSPDEKYIVFTRFLLKNGQNATDLYMSFRKKNGDWTQAQKLGPSINSSGANNNPMFSGDGKYFFFSQIFFSSPDKRELKRYWVSTAMFEGLRESSLTPDDK